MSSRNSKQRRQQATWSMPTMAQHQRQDQSANAFTKQRWHREALLRGTTMKWLCVYFDVSRPTSLQIREQDWAQKIRTGQAEGTAKNDTRISGQAEVCLKLMLERNNQLFNEAHSLSCAALDFLDRLYLDWKFSASIMRKDEISISNIMMPSSTYGWFMTEYPAPPSLIEIRCSFASPRLFQFFCVATTTTGTNFIQFLDNYAKSTTLKIIQFPNFNHDTQICSVWYR